jgi:alkyl hydroperoxide reductase subunit AhpC
LREWHDKYEAAGFTLIGVHSPEFFWEKPLTKIREATQRLGIKFPVMQDNRFDIWKRYGVRAWPTIVLVDRKGIIRYSHIGEGAYQRTEAMITQLLAETS